ncbi:MAG: 5'/3'-nucleotidase SurE [Beutenbergiaceae bacterium]
MSSNTVPRLRTLAGVLAALCAAALLLMNSAPAFADRGHGGDGTDLSGLRILLTNDDSMQAQSPRNSDGLGLYEMRRALCAAGADVVVIAPWAVQSGKGSAVTNSGTFSVGEATVPAGYQDDCAGAPTTGPVYGLCLGAGPCDENSGSATPSDTVMFATRGGLATLVGWGEPDLVVSGSNSGANAASSVNDSGTVGAAVAAVADNLPAVAFSTQPAPDFSVPVGNYVATADWGAQFLADLNARGLLLQHQFALSVNYPDISQGQVVQDPEWVEVGSATVALHGYTQQEDGSWKVGLSLCSGLEICKEGKRNSDWQALGESHITVTPITWDRTYGVRDRGSKYYKLRNFVNRYDA